MNTLKHREDGRAGMRAGWEVKTLGEVLEIQNGYAFDSKCFNPTTGLPLIRIRSLKSGTETETYYNGNYDEKYVVHCGDLLIGMDGEFGCYEWKGEPALLNQRVCRLRNFSDDLDPKFLFYGVNTHLKAIEDVTGFATVKHLSSKQILSIEFPLPPLAEQQRIVAILDEAFEGIATARKHAEQNLQNAKALFESHLQTTFTQSGQGWVEQKLGEISEFKNGLNYNKSSSGQTLPVVGVADFQDNYSVPFSELQSATIDGHLAENYTIQPNDILTVRSNGSKHLVGRCMLVGHVDEAVSYSGFIIRIRFDAETIFPQFLLHFMKCQVTRDILTAGGGGANINNINQEKLSSLIVPLPPYKIQIKIAADLDALRDESNRLCDIYTQKIAALDALKKSLLHQAFSGEL